MNKKNRMKNQNLYQFFIDCLREKAKKGFASNPCLQKHHVWPKHDGGPKDGETVLCTIRDHARAHYIRYKVYGQPYDLMAYLGLVGRTDEMQAEITRRILETNRERNNGPFNVDWQKEMANRPKSSYYFQENPEFARSLASNAGKIGGKTMTEKKRAVLKKNGHNVGTKYGRIGGLKHQHPLTQKRLSSVIEWEHSSGITVISTPHESVGDLVDFLNFYVPGSVQRANHFSEVLRGVTKSRFGWRIVKELDLSGD